MKKSLLFLSLFISSISMAQTCNELFISEYVEGKNNNKALEIYNPTNQTIDLSQYFVTRFSNGSSVFSAEYSVQLSGFIAPYDVYVGVLDKRDASGTGLEKPVDDTLQMKADGFYSPTYASNKTFYWNGNDAIVLGKGSVSNLNAGTLIDVFGKISQDPENSSAGTLGWSSIFPHNMTSGNPLDRVVTEDHSMIRKPSVLIGKNNPAEVLNPSYVFDPLAQYDSIPILPMRDANGEIVEDPITGNIVWLSNWSTLGWHDCNCEPLSVNEVNKPEVSIFPNPSNGNVFIKNADNFKEITIYNSLGQKLETIALNGKSVLSIDLSGKTGVYLLKLTGNDGSNLTKRVIIK